MIRERTRAGLAAARGVGLLLMGSLVFYLLFFHSLANLPLHGRPDNLEIIARFAQAPVDRFVH